MALTCGIEQQAGTRTWLGDQVDGQVAWNHAGGQGGWYIETRGGADEA